MRSGITISRLRNRHRTREAGDAGTYVDVRVGGGFAGVVNISDITTWVRAGAVPGEQFVLDLHGAHAYTLSGINPILAQMAGVYRGAAPSKRQVAASVAGV